MLEVAALTVGLFIGGGEVRIGDPARVLKSPWHHKDGVLTYGALSGDWIATVARTPEGAFAHLDLRHASVDSEVVADSDALRRGGSTFTLGGETLAIADAGALDVARVTPEDLPDACQVALEGAEHAGVPGLAALPAGTAVCISLPAGAYVVRRRVADGRADGLDELAERFYRAGTRSARELVDALRIVPALARVSHAA